MTSTRWPYRSKASTRCSYPLAVAAKPPGIKPGILDNAGLPKTHDVGEDFSALDHTILEHHQVLLAPNQIRRRLCNVGRSIHRDANVRGSQCGSIIDTVAHESHDMSLGPENMNDSLLVRWREPCEECCLLCRLGQFGVGHFLDFITQQHRVGEKADVAAYF